MTSSSTLLKAKQIIMKSDVLTGLYYFILYNSKTFRVSPIQRLKTFYHFFKDYKSYHLNSNINFTTSIRFLRPQLEDKLTYTPIDPTYFFQDTWAARKIFQSHPEHHFDVGSSVKTMAVVSQFLPLTLVDIRPINLELENLFFVKGSITKLPFADNSIKSLSSLCVIEHIGLGRYGDELDEYGSEKAVAELVRVLSLQGNLYVSLPVDCESRVYFNDCRSFTREHVLKLFIKLELVEEKYQYGRKLFDRYDSSKGFGTGLFHFRKEKRC